MSIVSLAEAKVFVGKAAAISDAELGRLNLIHGLAERAVKRYLRSSVEQATYTHLLPREMSGPPDGQIDELSGDRIRDTIHGGCVLALPELPVRSVSAVYEDRGAAGGQGSLDFPSETLLAAGTDYYLDTDQTGLCRSGGLYRLGVGWPRRPRSVKVTYVAGWSADELAGDTPDPHLDARDLRLAVLYAIRHHLAQAGTTQSALAAERLGDYAATYVANNLAAMLPRESIELLGPFVRKEYL